MALNLFLQHMLLQYPQTTLIDLTHSVWLSPAHALYAFGMLHMPQPPFMAGPEGIAGALNHSVSYLSFCSSFYLLTVSQFMATQDRALRLRFKEIYEFIQQHPLISLFDVDFLHFLVLCGELHKEVYLFCAPFL